ncbi:hypothetical protein BO85DRAFT_37639 [Aspergillus piperis CBS 112811]|uniref:Uncharacterized protein n=1 Tax=Aspergillus piperis CBS 112811 TaxID=1448313 RepID=A0A8G1QZJ4_9EURO|nr:hypothetical protein BO85DRAFT_37639 [Aspergillus piperis CBS 112811]RAH57296.1 hypothetical protein BO85DRAFT_37639 [Aspergillus piperis CBS 112811]
MELGRVRPFAGTGLGDIPTSRLDLMSVYLHSPPDGSITSRGWLLSGLFGCILLFSVIHSGNPGLGVDAGWRT